MAGKNPWLARLQAAYWRLSTRLRAVRGEGEIPFARLRQPLSEAKVALITTAGVHRCDQIPFDIQSPDGDWSSRTINGDVDVAELMITHGHYDTSDAWQDLDCVFPLRRLRELVAAGRVGSVSPVHFGLMGYIPQPEGLLRQTAPAMAKSLRAAGVSAVVLSPG